MEAFRAVVWNEQQRPGIGDRLEVTFYNVADGFAQLSSRPESSPSLDASPSSADFEVAVPRQMKTYLLIRDCCMEVARFA